MIEVTITDLSKKSNALEVHEHFVCIGVLAAYKPHQGGGTRPVVRMKGGRPEDHAEMLAVLMHSVRHTQPQLFLRAVELMNSGTLPTPHVSGSTGE